MHSCLKIDFVLQNVISRLSLSEKITLLSLSVGWHKVVLVCLRKQKCLATTEFQEGFDPWDACHEHTVSNDNIIKLGYEKLDTWNLIASWFSSLHSIYFDLSGDRNIDQHSHIFKLLLSTNAKTLKCVTIRRFQLEDEEPFSMVDSLPELKHWIAGDISVTGMDNIIKACPKIEHLRCCSEFGEWHLLPKDMKYLGTSYGEIMGLHNILKSDFVSSLETLERVLMTPVLSSMPFTFASLKRLEVVIEEDTNGCLYNLSRILINCPVLDTLKIQIRRYNNIDKESWTNVIKECPNVTDFRIFLVSYGESIKFSPWHDYVAELIGSRMKKIQNLDLGFPLSSKGFLTLEKVENLKSLRHHLYIREMLYEYDSDADALLRLLSSHFAKNMTKYEMHIPCPCQTRFIVPESFLSSIEKMESELAVKFDTSYNMSDYSKDQPHPEIIQKMVHLVTLSANK